MAEQPQPQPQPLQNQPQQATQSNQQQHQIAFLIVTNGALPPDSPGGLHARIPEGARYHRDALRGLLQLIGCKSRHTHKVLQLIFAQVAQRLPELSRASNRRAASACTWGVHPHGEQHAHAQCVVSMDRMEFNELICRCLQEYHYKYSANADELKVAGRWE